MNVQSEALKALKVLCAAELEGLHGQQPELLRMSILDKQSDIHQPAEWNRSTDEDIVHITIVRPQHV
ncbi:hypothetical protein ACET3Z_021543 [Daucus carota]